MGNGSDQANSFAFGCVYVTFKHWRLTLRSWKDFVEAALQKGVKHVTAPACYLTVEEAQHLAGVSDSEILDSTPPPYCNIFVYSYTCHTISYIVYYILHDMQEDCEREDMLGLGRLLV